MSEALLSLRGLTTVFHLLSGAWPAVKDVSLTIRKGEVVGLVGESGSGKSVTGFSITRLIDAPGEVVSGEIVFDGTDLMRATPEAMRDLRGSRIAMIFQDPLMTLNPVLTIGEQMGEAISEHRTMAAEAVQAKAVEALTRVGITSPQARLKQYPHELSGGMRQRVAIATALLNSPDLIIADEPTTALDVTIQNQILYEVQQLVRDTGTAVLWITHDLAVIAELADRVAVMYAGQIIEDGPVDDVLNAPHHPYTLGLLQSSAASVEPGEPIRTISGMAPPLDGRPSGCAFRTRCDRAQELCATTEPLRTGDEVRGVRCHFPLTGAA